MAKGKILISIGEAIFTGSPSTCHVVVDARMLQ
jgi:hypothetical protein